MNSRNPESSSSIVRQTLDAWRRRDLEGSVSYFAEAIVHSLNIDARLAPYVASAVGKAAVKEKLGLILLTFEFEKFEITSLTESQNGVRTRVEFRFRHIKSGEILQSHIQFLFKLRGHQIVLIEETHDAPYLEAFLRLVAASDHRN